MTFQRMDKKTVTLIDSICASAADDMGIAEIELLISGLIKVRDLQASEDHAEKRRIQRMNATSVDPKYRPIISRVNGELKRIGFEGGANEFSKVGTLKKLNDALSAAAMPTEKRIQLKENMKVSA
jgi:hypothetical protein